MRKWISNLQEGIQLNKNLIKKINNGWMPPHTTLFIKKDLLKKIGQYDEKLKISSDYDFIIKLFREDNLRIFFLNKVTVKMKVGGISNKNIKNIFIKMSEDISIMKKYKLNIIKAILIKNLSRLNNFLKS